MQLKRLRISAGRARRDVAQELGVSISTISRWEGGERVPRRPTLRRIAELYGVRMADIELPGDMNGKEG